LACAVAALASACSEAKSPQAAQSAQGTSAAEEPSSAAPPSGGVRYLALGDSLTQGVGAVDESTGAFPALLAEHWRADGCEVELQKPPASRFSREQSQKCP
jgi:acyl-CoA thioesterase I